MEVMKGGAMIGTLDLSAQACYTFGRAPTNDVLLEHPSASRWVLLGFRGAATGRWWTHTRTHAHACTSPRPPRVAAGRTPWCSSVGRTAWRLLLAHPGCPARVPFTPACVSCRLHGVVQFRGEDGAAFLFDPGSTHGVFVNKKRVPALKYIPLRCAGLVSGCFEGSWFGGSWFAGLVWDCSGGADLR